MNAENAYKESHDKAERRSHLNDAEDNGKHAGKGGSGVSEGLRSLNHQPQRMEHVTGHMFSAQVG